MNDPIFDDEHEALDAIGRGQFWIAAFCLALSMVSCIAWVVMLI